MPREIFHSDGEMLVLRKLSKVHNLIVPDLTSEIIAKACTAEELDSGGSTKVQGSKISPAALVFLMRASSRSTKLIGSGDVAIVHPLDEADNFGLSVLEALELEHSLLARSAAPVLILTIRTTEDYSFVPIIEQLLFDVEEFRQ